MSDFESGVQSTPELKVGDRVRYVPRRAEWYTPDEVWQRRSERDSIIVGLPDPNRYPDYRMVTIFEPGEETTWSDRDFWFAPALRLQRVETETSLEVVRRDAETRCKAYVVERDLRREIEKERDALRAIISEMHTEYQIWDTKRDQKVMDVPEEDLDDITLDVPYWEIRQREVGPWRRKNEVAQ